MGDSIEEMLNVTIKRLQFIMDNTTPEEALQTESYNLIDAAIVLLKTNTEDIDQEKILVYLDSLQHWAKDLYIASLKASDGQFAAGQFHSSGKLMNMICLCKIIKERMEKAIKEADAEEPHQPEKKTLAMKNGRPTLQ